MSWLLLAWRSFIFPGYPLPLLRKKRINWILIEHRTVSIWDSRLPGHFIAWQVNSQAKLHSMEHTLKDKIHYSNCVSGVIGISYWKIECLWNDITWLNIHGGVSIWLQFWHEQRIGRTQKFRTQTISERITWSSNPHQKGERKYPGNSKTATLVIIYNM